MPSWFTYVEKACAEAGVTPEYVFVCDRRDPTKALIDVNAEKFARTVHYSHVIERVKEEPHQHAWGNVSNLEKMVSLRNFLLEKVRELEPDLFLSLDSDILCHPQQIKNLIETISHQFEAVGGKVYLAPGRDTPSWAYYNRTRGLMRHNADHVFRVDVIMAVKLMLPAAYHVDYEFDKDGEDIGWSLACADRGIQLGHDGRVTSKHVMHEAEGGVSLIDKIDPRCGF